MQDKFSDDVSGAAVGPETSSENSPRTPCKNPKTKNQYSFHGESLKLRLFNMSVVCEATRMLSLIYTQFEIIRRQTA